MEHGGFIGRGVANDGFLRALLQADPFDEYHFFLPDQGVCAQLQEAMRQAFPDLMDREGAVRIAQRLELPAALSNHDYHCFHLSDCINFPPHLARLRNMRSPRIFPITSVTHSLSYTRYAPAFLAHMWPGCTARDVIIATSRSAVDVLDGYFNSLRRGYSLSSEEYPQPSVERIPLGIDEGAFSPPSAEKKAELRIKYEISPHQCAFLIFGRLSHFSKMDIAPIFRAVNRLVNAGTPAEKLCLIFAGADDQLEEDFAQEMGRLAASMGLLTKLVRNPSNKGKAELFSACDVFLSPADNLQETFGLTLLEAGAMGLPALVSDFDGYRDIVEHEKTGLLVPTVGQARSRSMDAAARVLFDNQAHLLLAQGTVVDVSALANAMKRLAEDDDFRTSLGRAARSRVLEHYTWRSVITKHIALWDELWRRRVPETEVLRAAIHPMHPSFAEVFGSYASIQADDIGEVQWSRAGQAVYRDAERPFCYAGVDMVLTEERLKQLLLLARNPIAFSRLVDAFSELTGLAPETAVFYALWALKQDFLAPVTPIPLTPLPVDKQHA